jgi:pilus assembly protein Flp/PilA
MLTHTCALAERGWAKVAALRDDRKGATAVEYGLMVAFIALAIIAAVTLVGTSLTGIFNNIAGQL